MSKLFSIGYTRFDAPKNMPTSGAWLGVGGQGTVDTSTDSGDSGDGGMGESLMENIQTKMAKAQNLEHVGWGLYRHNLDKKATYKWDKKSNKFLNVNYEAEDPNEWHEEKFVKNLEGHITGMGFKEISPHKFELKWGILEKEKIKEHEFQEQEFLIKLDKMGYREKDNPKGRFFVHKYKLLPNIFYSQEKHNDKEYSNYLDVMTDIDLDNDLLESLDEVASTVAPSSVSTGQYPARAVIMARRDPKKKKKFKDSYIAFVPLHTLSGLKMESETLIGGRGDFKNKKDFDSKEVDMGIKHEMEHTKDKKIALEICLDHLSENPNYYSELKAGKLKESHEQKTGETSYDNNHSHKYSIDENGNGKTISTESYDKEYPSHSHKIKNKVVEKSGKVPHDHKIKE